MKTYGIEPTHPDKDFGNSGTFGLTKREYFAAMAMQGILAQLPGKTKISSVAYESVSCADALIEQLNKEEK